MTSTPATMENPWPVAELGQKLHDYIERLGTVWVEGEITQWGGSGRNIYGKLKDLTADATISIIVWSSVRARIPSDLKQGDRVVALVKVNYWVKGGSLSMQVVQMKHVGLGDLLERIERLRAQLSAEGLFDPARKKALPFLPSCVGLVTAKGSDAEKDVLRNAQLRWPAVRFTAHHASVQGERTVPEVIAALEALDADPEVDVIIVARGGGDFQNLLGFSDERVVRAVAACRTPVVSAIGHENDHPILDDVADLRASTPTDAAKRVVPDVAEQQLTIQQARTRLTGSMTSRITNEISRLEQIRSRPALAAPGWIVQQRAEDLTRYVARGAELIDRVLEREAVRTAELTASLRTLSPKRTLERGYAIAQRADGHALRSGDEAPEGTEFTLTFARGRVDAVSHGPAEDAPTGADR